MSELSEGPLSFSLTLECFFLIAQPFTAAFTAINTIILHNHAKHCLSCICREICTLKAEWKGFLTSPWPTVLWLGALDLNLIYAAASLKGQKSDLVDGRRNQSVYWVKISLSTPGGGGEVRREDFGPTSQAVLLGLFGSASVCVSSLMENMKIDFAPLDVPLHRRLQTTAVVQWVFSFIALGECRCLSVSQMETAIEIH